MATFIAAACKPDKKPPEASPLGLDLPGLAHSEGISAIQLLGIPSNSYVNAQYLDPQEGEALYAQSHLYMHPSTLIWLTCMRRKKTQNGAWITTPTTRATPACSKANG